MTLKELFNNLNTITNNIADLEVTIREAARDCKVILQELEELPDPEDIEQEKEEKDDD